MGNLKFKSAIYGWSIVYQTSRVEPWQVDNNEDSNGLPAIFEDWEMVVDRFNYLNSHGVKARIVAVLVQPSDFGVDGKNQYDSGLGTPGSGWWAHTKPRKDGPDV